MKKKTALLTVWTLLVGASMCVAAELPPAVGEISGRPVLKSDFDFADKTFSIFSTTDKALEDPDVRRAEIWKHLIFLREADKRGVTVSPEELRSELSRLLKEKQIEYGSYAYIDFVRQTFGEDTAVFERRLESLLKVKKMLDGIMHPPPPVITEADAKQKFLNQYNSMNTEFVNFPTLEEATAFFKKTSAKKWDAAKKKDPKFSTPTGHISLEALIDLWQVPTEDAYRIHKLAIGSIAAPAKMYKGYGVFRVTEKKDADPKEYTQKKKEEYLKTLEQVYYYNHTQKVIQDILTNAAPRDYAKDKVMVFVTDMGTFEAQLFPKIAPKACENFIGLAGKKYYDGLLFHRVIKGFMIQGGDPTGTGRGGESIWGKPFEDEVNKDVQFDHGGLLAMANSGPGTNGSQFFVTVAPALHLNMKHTIFGEVTSGFDVVKKIDEVPTGKDDRPLKDCRIVRIELKKWPTSLVFN